MTINGVQFDPAQLMSKNELLKFLKENGESDRALSHIREQYLEKFDNELIWLYPISDGKHMGTFIAAVSDGFISLPYDTADKEDYELLELEDAAMLDADAMQILIDDWHYYSNNLLGSMKDMLQILISS